MGWNMDNFLNVFIILLLLCLIFKDTKFEKRVVEQKDEAKEQEKKERQKEFDNIMSYSIDTAIDSKRSER